MISLALTTLLFLVAYALPSDAFVVGRPLVPVARSVGEASGSALLALLSPFDDADLQNDVIQTRRGALGSMTSAFAALPVALAALELRPAVAEVPESSTAALGKDDKGGKDVPSSTSSDSSEYSPRNDMCDGCL